jgi:hypothetical protein
MRGIIEIYRILYRVFNEINFRKMAFIKKYVYFLKRFELYFL